MTNRHLVLVFALAAGCSSSPGGSALHVEGSLQSWTLGAGYQLVAAVNLGGHYTELGGGSIASDGTFSISVTNDAPAKAELQPLALFYVGTETGATCTQAPTVTPASLEVSQIALLVKDPTGKYKETEPLSMTPFVFVYTDVDGTATGTASCGAHDVELDLHMHPGFNVWIESQASAMSPISIKSGALPSPVVLGAFL